jgi:hypothetical protein
LCDRRSFSSLGYPGTGKLSVSKALVSRFAADGEAVRLVDNHATANILFDLISEADGRSLLPLEVLDNVREINLIVARTIENLSPRDWSFILTHHFRDSAQNRSYIDRLKGIADLRGSIFLPVVLTCEQSVLLDRIAQPERRSRNKLVDPTIAASIIERGMLVPDNSMTIDTTCLDPTESAMLIREELKRSQ